VKRHPALIPLSHDHHAELVQARRLRLASGSDVVEARLAAAAQYVDAFFTEITRHLTVEEEELFPALLRNGGGGALLDRLLAEHGELRRFAASLREQVEAGDAHGDVMAELAGLLEGHVRREERELFPLVEQTVPDDELRALELPACLTGAVLHEDDDANA
jgi:hemerythrin-like domain-containing protein